MVEWSFRAQVHSPHLTCCPWKTQSPQKKKGPSSSTLASPGSFLPRKGSQGCSRF